MRILLSGDKGFIGNHLASAFRDAGHEVVGFDLKDGRDIRESILDMGEFDVVSHHAALVDVRESMDKPEEYCRTNIMGSLNLLRSVRCKKFIFASSGGAIYAHRNRPRRECDPKKPSNPYGTTKVAFELLLTQSAVPAIILRYANVYGPGQTRGVIHQFINNREAVMYGDGKQVRDFIHISDVVDMNLLVLNADPDHVYNVGTGVGTSIRRLWKMIKPDRLPLPRAAIEGEVRSVTLDPSNARNRLGWQPQVSLQEGLASCR